MSCPPPSSEKTQVSKAIRNYLSLTFITAVSLLLVAIAAILEPYLKFGLSLSKEWAEAVFFSVLFFFSAILVSGLVTILFGGEGTRAHAVYCRLVKVIERLEGNKTEVQRKANVQKLVAILALYIPIAGLFVYFPEHDDIWAALSGVLASRLAEYQFKDYINVGKKGLPRLIYYSTVVILLFGFVVMYFRFWEINKTNVPAFFYHTFYLMKWYLVGCLAQYLASSFDYYFDKRNGVNQQ